MLLLIFVKKALTSIGIHDMVSPSNIKMSYAYLKEVKTWEDAMKVLKEELDAGRQITHFAQPSLDEFQNERYVVQPLFALPLEMMMGAAILNGPIQFPNTVRICLFILTIPIEGKVYGIDVFVCVPCLSNDSFDPIVFMAQQAHILRFSFIDT